MILLVNLWLGYPYMMLSFLRDAQIRAIGRYMKPAR